MICHTQQMEPMQFIYRGIQAVRSPETSTLPRWTAEVQENRGYVFLRADSIAEMRQRIDQALARRDRP